MALRDSNPSEEYPFVFLVEQAVYQSQIATHTENPKYTLSLAWKYYKVLADNSIVFKNEATHTYVDDDFYVSAANDWMNGVDTHFNTLSAQQASIKRIVEFESGKTLEVV